MSQQSSQPGFSTLEFLIVFAMLATIIPATVGLCFQNQEMVIDTQQHDAAINEAQGLLSNANAPAMFDQLFSTSTIDGTFKDVLTVNNISPCTKQVAAQINWTGSLSQSRSLELDEKVFDPGQITELGGDCLLDPVSNWLGLRQSPPLSIPDGTIITGLDAINGLVFLSASSTTMTGADFVVINARNPAQPVLLYQLHLPSALSSLDATLGSDGSYIIFAASKNASQQLMVLQMDKDLNTSPQIIAQASLPGVGGSYPGGLSVVYNNNFLYVGTHRTAGRELHVFNVADPAHPTWLSSLEVNHNINQLIASGKYLFAATSGNVKDVIVFDVSNPANITQAATLQLPGTEDGKSIFLLGSELFLGRSMGSDSTHPEFYLLDAGNIPTGLKILGSVYLHATINSVFAENNQVVLATDSAQHQLQVFDVTNPAAVKSIITYNLGDEAVGLDGQNGSIITATKSSSGGIFLY